MRPLAAITGASAGLGVEFARQLAGRGFDLLLIARRLDRLEALAAELSSRHSITAQAVAADLTGEDGLALVEKRLDTVDLLVNNAGFGTLGKFVQTTIVSQQQMHRLHVMATMRLSHRALIGMVGRDKGGIINVSSVAGFWQAPGNVGYCATKCWINSFTEGLSMELRSSGSAVRVQALCPGYTITEFHQSMGWDRGNSPAWLWMKAEDVVQDSLQGLERGQLFVVPGFKYKAAVMFMRWTPRFIKHGLAARQQKALKRA